MPARVCRSAISFERQSCRHWGAKAGCTGRTNSPTVVLQNEDYFVPGTSLIRTLSSHFSISRNARKGASGVRRRPSGLAPAGVVFRNNTSYHFPAAAGRRPSESRDGRPPISMARGGGSRPRVAPRIQPRAPRATRADTWRAIPPKTSGPATRPYVGCPAPPRRPGQAISLRASQVRPIQPARPAHKTHARSKRYLGRV